LEWWAEGRPATRDEVEHSVETGIPIIEAIAKDEDAGAMEDLAARREWIKTLYPPPAVRVGAA
jgi:hypothetical protein